jgi:hypothetical protein
LAAASQQGRPEQTSLSRLQDTGLAKLPRLELVKSVVGSPMPAVPQAVAASIANSKAQESALLHIDPFSLVRGSPADGRVASQSSNVADALLLSRHGGNRFRVVESGPYWGNTHSSSKSR